MILKNGKRIDSGCSDTVPIGSMNPFIGSTAPFGYLICQGQRESKTTYPELAAICGDLFGPSTATEFYLPDLRGQTIAGYKEGDPTFGTLGGLIGALTKSYTPAGKNTGTSVTMNAIELTHSGGAVQSHTLTTNEIPAHSHGNTIWWSGQASTGKVGITFNSQGDTNNKFWASYDAGGGQGHSHGFTQPSKHSFTPTTKSITQPTFTGTQADINVVQPTITLNWIVKAFNLLPNSSTVVNTQSESTSNVYSASFVNDLLEQLKRENFDFAHPVGSYYETSDSSWTPQAAGWYGTWVADNDGSALVSYKSSGAFNKTTGTIVGGESTSYTPAGKNTGTAVTMNAVELTHSGGAVGNHTLTTSEIPSHNHCIRIAVTYNGNAGNYRGAFATNSDWWGGNTNYDTNNRTNDVGGGQAHNHPFTQPSKHSFTPTTKSITQPTFTGTQANVSTIQTSKVVYRWHRTA